MRIENDFEVPAAAADAYALLVDLERVAPCIPGGEVGPQSDDGSHPAKIAVKLGPMKMSYSGRVRIVEREDASHRAVLSADVREQRGQGTAKAEMTMSVAATPGGSLVRSVTEVRLTGRAAQMGRGVVDDVAARLVADMAACVAAQFDHGEAGGDTDAQREARPIQGFRLLLRVLWERLKRPFRRPTERPRE